MNRTILSGSGGRSRKQYPPLTRGQSTTSCKKTFSEQYPLDDIFAEIEKTEPESFAVNQYKSFRVAAKRYTFLSCANRLQALNPTLEKLSVREFCDEQD